LESDAVGEIIPGVKDGRTFAVSFQQVLGLTVGEFEEDWHDWLGV
jgi:hypothetical protein